MSEAEWSELPPERTSTRSRVSPESLVCGECGESLFAREAAIRADERRNLARELRAASDDEGDWYEGTTDSAIRVVLRGTTDAA